MAEVYYNLVKNGLRTLDTIPEHLKKDVREMLDRDATTTPPK